MKCQSIFPCPFVVVAVVRPMGSPIPEAAFARLKLFSARATVVHHVLTYAYVFAADVAVVRGVDLLAVTHRAQTPQFVPAAR